MQTSPQRALRPAGVKRRTVETGPRLIDPKAEARVDSIGFGAEVEEFIAAWWRGWDQADAVLRGSEH